MVIVLILAAMICAVMASVQIVKENKKAKERRLVKQSKQYSSVPWDADEYLKAFLEENKRNNKEFKLAALIVEDQDGYKYVEDIDLRGDSAEPVSLSQFAVKRRCKDKADNFLYSSRIIDVISKKVNSVIGDTNRYYAFELTLENVLSGRHGKTKKKVVNNYVMLLDLDQLELTRIANLSY